MAYILLVNIVHGSFYLLVTLFGPH